MKNLFDFFRAISLSVVIIFCSFTLSQCSHPNVEPVATIDSKLLKFAKEHRMNLIRQDLSTKPLLSFKTLEEAQDFFANNPKELRLSLRKAVSKDEMLEKTRLAQGVYYSSGTYFLDNINQYGVKTLLLSIKPGP